MSGPTLLRKAYKAAAALLTEPPTRWQRLMQARFELEPKDAVDAMAADENHARLVGLLTTYSGDRARMELREARQRFADDPSPENQKAMEAAQMIYPQAVESYRALRSQAKEACKKHGATVLKPIAQRVFSKALAQLDARLAELKAEEALVLEKHALPYEPSPLARALGTLRSELETAANVFESNPTATLQRTFSVLV